MPSEIAKIGSGVARQNRPAGLGTVQPPPSPSPKRAEEYSGLQKLWYADTISPKIWTVAWLGLGTTALVLIALIAGLVLRLERQYFVNLQHAYVIVIDALDVLSDTECAEARERGYLLTGDPSYIEPYQGSRKALDEEFDRLRELVKNNPKEREQVEKLRYLVQQKLDELQAAIDVRTAAGPEAARALVRTGRGDRNSWMPFASISAGWKRRSRARWHDSRGIGGRNCGPASRLSLGALFLAGLLSPDWPVALARSTSQRQRAEEELSASNSRFETLCEQAPLGIYETDADGSCVYTNRMVDHNVWAQCQRKPRAWLGEGAASGRPRNNVRRMGSSSAARDDVGVPPSNPQGKTRWIRAVGGPLYSAQGSLTGYVGTLEDVTERKQAVQALQESEALNRAVLNSLPANIAVLKADGKIQATNEAWQRFAQSNGDPTRLAWPTPGPTTWKYASELRRMDPRMPRRRLPEFKMCWQACGRPSKCSIPATRVSKRDGFICWSLAWLGPSVARL